MTGADNAQGNPKSQATTVVKSTDGPVIKFPPFPTQPNTGEGASIIPFKHFKEHGIRIFSDTGVEIDDLGIPTIELDVIHDLDECKTETRRKLKDGRNVSEGKRGKIAKAVGEAPVGEPVKLNPMEKARDRRTQRFLLFAKKEWFDQWSEGEHLRGLKTYDPNLSSISRIHQASTDFRTGRIWPPAHTQLMYLWDQFRLHVGLLGTTPIWTRTDLPQPEEANDEDENEIEGGPTSSPLPRHKGSPNLDVEMDLASDFDDDDEAFMADINQTRPTNESEQYPQPPPQPPRKRLPLRTPYELYNKDPIPVSSDTEVHALLARATLEKETKLLAFLSDPEKSVKVFLSSYLRKEGLIWTPSFLTYLPLLLTFFLSFLIRTHVLPECERQLKRALEIAREAVTQLPCTGRLCRILPDAMGKGAKGCWGAKWEDKWDFEPTPKKHSKPTEALPEEPLKMFEDEVKKANLQLLSKETIFGPEPIAPISVNVNEQSDDEDISIQIMSPTSPEPKTPTALVNQLIPETTKSSKDSAHTWGKPNWALAPDTPALPDSPPPLPPAQLSFTTVVTSELPPSNLKEKETQISDDESEDSEEDPRSWASPTGRPPTRSQKLAEKVSWFPPPTQPLMGIFGMTILPLRFESGIAERSLRRVASVLKPGEGGGKWRGVEEELVKRLARVVLEPWLDWGGEGIAPDFMAPTLVGGDTLSSLDSTKAKEGGEIFGKTTHDPLKDDITILVEPHVINSLNVGMGMAGTWVQMVPLRSVNSGGGHGRGRGNDGGGRGRGGGARAGRKEQRFWYVDELALAIPTFWTMGEEVEEIEADEEDIANIGRRWGLKK